MIHIREIQNYLQCDYCGKKDVYIHKICSLDDNDSEGAIAFYQKNIIDDYLKKSKASVILVPENIGVRVKNKNLLLSKNPKIDFIKIYTKYFKKQIEPAIHPSAVIDSVDVSVSKDICIGAHVYIGNNVQIGKNVVIEPNSTVHSNTFIGNNVHIGSNTCLGNDGFGFEKIGHRYIQFPQISNLIIEDNVYIGSNSNINKGTLSPTIISRNVIIDDHVHIAHNVEIGENTVIAGMSGIAGSSKIGKNCILAGKVGIKDHIHICDNVIIMGASNVVKNITKPGKYSGTPAIAHTRNLRNLVDKFKSKS